MVTEKQMSIEQTLGIIQILKILCNIQSQIQPGHPNTIIFKSLSPF